MFWRQQSEDGRSLDLVEAAQVELPEAQHRFDDTERRFRPLFWPESGARE